MTSARARFARRLAFALLLGSVLPGPMVLAGDGVTRKDERQRPDPVQEVRVRRALTEMPMRFEPNLGRITAPVDFVARGAGYSAYLSPHTATLALHDAVSGSGVTVRMRLARAMCRTAGKGERELAGRTNDLTGNDPRRWRSLLRQWSLSRSFPHVAYECAVRDHCDRYEPCSIPE